MSETTGNGHGATAAGGGGRNDDLASPFLLLALSRTSPFECPGRMEQAGEVEVLRAVPALAAGAEMMISILEAMLTGSQFCTALRDSGKPGRVKLPADPAERRRLIVAHLAGESASLQFCAEGASPWREIVQSVQLAGYCPGADGLCRWVALDLDAADHGQRGLSNPDAALRCLAERADAAGLSDGLLVARSRGGRGRHMFLFPPAPVDLIEGAIAVGALAAAARRIADEDVLDFAQQHAFARVSGGIVVPGESGACELFPRSTEKPVYGWALALPARGKVAAKGGGILIDPFTGKPCEPEAVPAADVKHWAKFLRDARRELEKRLARRQQPRRMKPAAHHRPLLERLDPRTRQFLEGNAPEGSRNCSAFAAACNLLGVGATEREVEALIHDGAARCGLSEHEVKTIMKSALRRRGRT